MRNGTWHAQIRAAFIAAGHPLDDDIVEELAQHAESAFESARARGRCPRAAWARPAPAAAAWRWRAS